MIQCPQCATENLEGSKFCTKCGTRLDAVAPPAGPKRTTRRRRRSTSSAPPEEDESDEEDEEASTPAASAATTPQPATTAVAPAAESATPTTAKRKIPTWAMIAGGCGGLVFCCLTVVCLVLLMGALRPSPTPTGPGGGPGTGPGAGPVGPGGNVAVQIRSIFAKDMTQDVQPVQPTTTFARTDPHVVQVLEWAPEQPAGTTLGLDWYVGGKKIFEKRYSIKPGVTRYGQRVSSDQGWPPGQYEVHVSINGARALVTGFTVQ